MFLRLQNVTKKFRWYDRENSLKSAFAKMFKKKFEKKEWTVLQDINFQLSYGEQIGIIGRNGSGKSTLLKIIARIYEPDSGKVINKFRRVFALLELGAGFFPDLTGRDNLRLNWSFAGLKQAELKKKFFDIVEFAGLDNFIDTPLKYYSSGMVARLAFSIAAFSEPDLLIIDEVLSVGDADFKERSFSKIKELLFGGTSLIFVSHNLDEVKSVCPRTIYIERGRIEFDGDTTQAIFSYEKNLNQLKKAEIIAEL